jgi:hypothetical protein
MSAGRIAIPVSVLTIGHSTHPLDSFLALLAQHGIEALADIRRFRASRKHPQFNRHDLAMRVIKKIDIQSITIIDGRVQPECQRPLLCVPISVPFPL